MVRSRLLALGFGLLLVLLGGELLGRALGPGPRPPGPPSVNAAAWVFDAELGFVNGPDLDFPNHAVRGRPRVRTDAHGLRRGGPEGAPRLLVVGDSTSFGAEVEDHQTLPARLGTALGWPVANAGVRGYSTVQAARQLSRQLGRLHSVEAVLYVLTTNDLVENFRLLHPAPAPLLWRNRDEQRWEILEPDLAHLGARSGGSVVAASRPPGARWRWRTRLALVDFGVDAARILMRERRTPTQETRNMLRPAPGNEGTGWGAPDREAGLAHLLGGMVEAAREGGLPLLVTVFPGTPPEAQAALVPGAGSFRALVEGCGGVFLAVPEDFPYLSPRLRARRPWIGYDPHFGAEGTRRWAEALLPALRAALSPSPGA